MAKRKKKHHNKEGNSCRPPSGKTYLTIGQDFYSIQKYISSQSNSSETSDSIDSLYPAATMFYTNISVLGGFDEPNDYGGGIEYAEGLAETFPGKGIQIGLWLNGTVGCQNIIEGKLDQQINKLYSYLGHLNVPKIFLRVGYEFDNPSFGYSGDPSIYKHAFRKIVRVCKFYLTPDRCHSKIAFTWHSWAAVKIAPLEDFYPGDDVVDWVAISVFQQLYPWANNKTFGSFAGGNKDQVVEVLKFAKRHHKPVMIAESTPFGGMQVQPPSDFNYTLNEKEELGDVWDLWFQPTLDLIGKYDIAMWSYINCDWDSQEMWNGVGFGDTRINSDPRVMKKWKEDVLGKNSRFLLDLECAKSSFFLDYSSSSLLHTKSLMTSGISNDDFIVSTFLIFWVLPAMSILSSLYLLYSCVRHHCCQLRVDNEVRRSLQQHNWYSDKVTYGSICPQGDLQQNESSMSLNL